MSDWMSFIDQELRKAIEAGKFSNLPGEGKPLPRNDDEQYVPDELKMAHKILKDNDLAPDWIIQGKELEAARQSLLQEVAGSVHIYRDRLRAVVPGQSHTEQRRFHADAEWEAARQKLRETAARLNQQILTYNLKTPPGVAHKTPINIEREIERVL